MSLTYILERYDAIGVYSPKMEITLDQSFTGSAALATMFQSAFGQDAITITCMSWDRSAGDDFLRLTGTANLLNIENAEVLFSASQRNDDLLVTLTVTIPSGWSFLQSFPTLPGYYDPNQDEPNRIKPSFLNELSLGACKLVFTNQAHRSETLNVDLLPGLSFAGELYFMGALFGVKTLTGMDGPVFVSGPLREYRSSPDPLEFLGVRLRAPIAMAGSDWPIPITNASIFIKTPVDEDQVDHTVGITKEPGIYFFGEVEIDGRTAELVARYNHTTGSSVLSLYGRMTDFGIAGFSSLAQTTGGDDVESRLPAEIQTPQGLRLTEFGLMMNFTSLGILSVMVGVGMDTHWEIVPDKLVLEEIGTSLCVRNPFDSKNRSVAVTISGAVAIADAKLVIYAEFPTYRFGGGLPADETMSLGHVIKAYFPKAPLLPDMTITSLLFDADPSQKTFAMACSITDVLAIPVGATTFNIEGVAFAVNYNKSAGVTGAFTAEMTIAEVTAILSGELTETLTLSGSLQEFDLKKFWSLVTGGEQLPGEVPDIIFNVLTVSVSPDTGSFSALGNTTIAWDFLPEGNSLSTNVEFSFTHTVIRSAGSRMSTVSARLSLQGTGPAEIAPGFELNAFNFLFDYQTGIGWKLSGGMSVHLFDTALSLQAGYETSQVGQKMKFQAIATPATRLIHLKDVGSYSFTQFDLLLDRRAMEGGKKQTFFDLRLASTLKLDHVFEIGGYLSISKAAETGSALLFKPHKDTGSFSIDFPAGEGFGIKAELFEIGFVKESAAAGWAFTGTTYLGFKGLSSGWAECLPSRVFAKIVAGQNNARISALNVTDPIEVALPAINGQKLGKAVIALTELGIAVKPELGLVLEAGLGLPAELNTFLGGRQVFRVYQKGNLLSMARTRFTISGTAIAMQFISSPFAGANAVVIKGEAWFDIDFGKYGAISLKMPTFVYDGVTQYFEAGGGCKITRTLALPLKPLKYFLMACGLQDFANIFPDMIPAKGLMLVDKDNHLKVDEFITFLKQAGGVPNEVIKVLKETGEILNRFPDGFKHYFNIEIPEQLEFRFGFSPAGRISLGLLAPKQPIRVLFPSVVQSYVPMPGLTGIELRKLTVGTLMSGSVFFGEVDATIDQFDMPSLVVSLMLPKDEAFPLPTSNQLQRRIILDDVFCIIPASQGLPIPIPVFYDQIAFEYLGVEGVGLQAHMSFPKPPLSGSGASAFFTTLKEFTSNDKALLDPKTPPGGLDLVFTFRDEYLLAPEYLGGGTLGSKGKDVKVSLWKYVATMMNFFKTFSINDFIGAIPYEYRVGSAAYKFAFMKFDADWLLTTPDEFKAGAFEKLKLTASDRDDFMDVLPSVATTGGKQVSAREEGLILFMRGQADLAFVRLEAVFGLAASGSMGFNTGFKLDGTIAKIIELELSGAVMVNAPLATVGPTVTPVPLLPSAEVTVEPGRALSLDGKDAWVEIPASDSLVLPEYTIELWIRPGAGQSEDWVQVFGLDTQHNGHHRNYYLELHTRSNFYHHRFTDAGGGNSGAPDTPRDSVRWGLWQHITLTNDGVTAKTLIDGKEAASSPVNGKLTLFKAPIFIGKIPGSGRIRFFKGDIAEVRIWKRARPAAEVEAQMREVLRGDEKDLVSLYRFGANAGNKAVDVCGRNHGTITNGSIVDSGILMLDGLAFNGSGDYIEVDNSQSLELGAYTVEAWLKPKREMRGWGGVVGKTGRNYSLYLNSNGFAHHRFHTERGTNDGAPDTPNDVVRWDGWNHIAITNDGKTARTFVNGVKQSEGPVVGTLFVDKGKLQIGRTADAHNSEFFMGDMAEIRIWSQARSLDQLSAQVYQRLTGKEANLVSLYRLGEARGDTLPDVCNRNAGRAYMATRLPEPRQALSLDGKDAWVEIPASDSLMLPEYTIELWVRPGAGQKEDWVEVFGLDTQQNGHQRNYYLELHTQSNFYHHRFTDAGGGNSGAPDTPEGSAQWGQWQHITLTNDGVTAKTLIDGKEAASGPVNGTLTLFKAPIFIGKAPGSGRIRFFKGDIAEVRIWKRARSAAEVEAQMREVLRGDEKDLVSLYRFGANMGSTAVDACGRNHGTITNGRFTDFGVLMLDGLTFNGSGDYIEVDNSQSLELGAYTVEAWLKPKREIKGWGCVVGKTGRNYSLYLNTNGFAHHRFHTERGTNDGAPDTPNDVVRWDQWNHIAITNDGKTARTFVNGVKQSEGPVVGTLFVDKGKLQIGRTADAYNGEFFMGDMAEIRIWAQARSLDELSAQMHQRLTGKEANLVSLYRLGEAKGGTLPDVCDRNAGRAYMFTRPPEGLTFNGSGDYIEVENSPSLEIGTYTVEAWFKPQRGMKEDWAGIAGKTGRNYSMYIHRRGFVHHRFHTERDMSDGIPDTPDEAVQWGGWNHVAITNDGKTARTFVNGVMRSEGPVSGRLFVDKGKLQIGRTADALNQAFFFGDIAEIRIWSQPRSLEEINAQKYQRLSGKEANLVSLYRLGEAQANALADVCTRNPGRMYLRGADWALAVAPPDQKRAALQIQGHTHITVAGHKAMVGDLRVIQSQAWFRGELDLFPKNWPIRVHGYVEGVVNQNRFYLSGETENKLFGLVLTKSRLYLSNDQIRLEGRWMGAYTLLDISWVNGNPVLKGAVVFDASPSLQFGAIRMGGVKVADNVRLSLDIHADVAVVISRTGFSADVHASFSISGKGFTLSFRIEVAPSNVDDLIHWITQRLIDDPDKYLEHLFLDAAEWLENIGTGAIDFAKDASEAVGAALKQAYGVTKEELAGVMQEAGYRADQVGAALSKAYGASAQEATNLLKGVGYSAEHVGKALQSAYQSSAEDAARLLRGIGYSTKEVGDALQYTFGKGADECATILNHVGFPPHEVSHAIQAAGTTVAKEAEKVGSDIAKTGKKVGKKFKKLF